MIVFHLQSVWIQGKADDVDLEIAEKKKRRTRKKPVVIVEKDPIEEDPADELASTSVKAMEIEDPIEDAEEAEAKADDADDADIGVEIDNSFLLHVWVSKTDCEFDVKPSHSYENFTDVKFKRKQARIEGTPLKISAGLAYPFLQGDSYIITYANKVCEKPWANILTGTFASQTRTFLNFDRYVDSGAIDDELQLWVCHRDENDGSDRWNALTLDTIRECGVPEDSDFYEKVMEIAQTVHQFKK